MGKKRITPEMLHAARERIAEAKAERPIRKTDANGEPVRGPWGNVVFEPPRFFYDPPPRLAAALRFPPSEIRALRIAMGRTQKEQAQALGVAVRTYQAWEAGDSLPANKHLVHMIHLRDKKDPPALAISAIVRRLREARRNTVQAFALTYGVTPSTVTRWEAGKVVPRSGMDHDLRKDYALAVELDQISSEKENQP